MRSLSVGLLLVLLAVNPMRASALEIAGIKLDDSATLRAGGTPLLLNGAGVRTRLLFKVYVGALYLQTKTNDEAAVLAEASEKRLALHMLRELSADQFLSAIQDGLNANNDKAELTPLQDRLATFYDVIRAIPSVHKGDVILLDYRPDSGTQVTVNGSAKGVVAGADFNRALLKIWLGPKPVDNQLKKGLLGGH
ncbi:MAG: chalcone isomerase family protein [Gammaproteobacteria bacterium]